MLINSKYIFLRLLEGKRGHKYFASDLHVVLSPSNQEPLLPFQTKGSSRLCTCL